MIEFTLDTFGRLWCRFFEHVTQHLSLRDIPGKRRKEVTKVLVKLA